MPERPATGQWLVSQGTGWFFDSGALCLDFAATGAIAPGVSAERLHSPTDLGAWLAERFPRLDAEPTERELADALGLRAALAAIAVAVADGRRPDADDVDTV